MGSVFSSASEEKTGAQKKTVVRQEGLTAKPLPSGVEFGWFPDMREETSDGVIRQISTPPRAPVLFAGSDYPAVMLKQ